MSEKQTNEDANVYELAYLLVPSITEEELAAETTALKDAVATFGAEFIADEEPKLIDLAYQMERDIANKKNKFTNGYFGWVKFNLDPAQVAPLNESLGRNDKLIRFMIISTVAESTIAPKKAPRIAERRRRRRS
jgi:ribosomal protein S6